MSGQEFKAFQLSKQEFDENLLDEFLCLQERKIDVMSEELEEVISPLQKKNHLRGKGRPKGEKNSKEPSKRKRDILSDENRKRGHWSLEENKRYHWFLEIYNNHFICKQMRRLDKIFKTMANFIGTREAEQCRSHHQKMEKKYHTFSNILLFLRQVHYQTDETAPILEDMNRSEVEETAHLLDPRELNRMDTPKTSIATLPFLSEDKEQQIIEISKFVDFGDNDFNTFDDLLGDNYQLRLDLDNLLI